MKKIIVPSQYLANCLRQVFPYEFTVVENGIKPFNLIDVNKDWEGVRFGYIGTMQPHKGWTLLIDAFSSVHAEYPDSQLRIYGGIPDFSVPCPGVSFSGLYKRSELPRILSEINVGVIPSLFPETYSMVLSELWQGQVVPLVSDIGAMQARVQDGVNGKKIQAGDKTSLINGLKWFIENDEWRSWHLPQPRLVEEMSAEYNKYYQEILGTKKEDTFQEPLVGNF